MNRQKALLALALALILVGCAATPKIKTNSSEMAMEVKTRVPFVGAVAYSPDGKTLATGGINGAPQLWDLANARVALKFAGENTDWINYIAYSPDGKTLASAPFLIVSDAVAALWDVATGKVVRNFTDDFGGRLSFSRDGRYLLGDTSLGLSGDYGKVKVKDIQTGAVVKEVRGDEGKISPDGKYFAAWGLGESSEFVDLWEMTTGRQLWTVNIGEVSVLTFSPDSKLVLAVCQKERNMPFLPDSLTTDYKLLDIATGQPIKEFSDAIIEGGFFGAITMYHHIKALEFSPDGKFALSGDLSAQYKLWDLASGRMVRQLPLVDEISGTGLTIVPAIAFSPEGRSVAVTSLAAVRHFDLATGEEIASMIAFEDGEWLFVTPNGYYNASEKGDQYLNVAVGGKPYSIAQLRESFFRPDLVRLALSGGSLKDFRKLAEIKQPPTVAIVDTPGKVTAAEAVITLKVSDAGGGIGDIRLYLNGSAVMLDSSRGVAVVPAGSQTEVHKQYTVKLSSGVNTIRAIAFNGDNSMQSSDALHEITATYKAIAKPSLYALVIGINEYKNPKLQLNYAVADAGLFADTLEKGAAQLFDQVVVKRLATQEETTRENIIKELKAMQSLNPDDLFVFYVASHGTVDDGEYFLVTSNVGSTSTPKLKTDALSQNTLKELMANIPATKKLIVIDTCSAGKLGDAIQTAMLTRGMSEDTAMKVLSRAVGSTILSASTSLQEALEGYQGHGLFTFVLAEGLNGKADKGKSGFVKTTELADYVDNEVPALAERIFNRAQYPTISISGMGFPIGQVQ